MVLTEDGRFLYIAVCLGGPIIWLAVVSSQNNFISYAQVLTVLNSDCTYVC